MSTFNLSNDTYDFLNRVVKYGLPAIGTLYFTIATIWELAGADKVLGTIAAVATFLGVWLAISKKNYTPETDGDLVFDDNEMAFQLHLNELPDEVTNKEYALLKVKNNIYPQ